MRQTAVLSALLVFGSTAFAADPQLMGMVMPDAKVLAGANGGNMRSSPLGQYIIARVGALNFEQGLIAATGFDPLQDVTEVLAASNGATPNPTGLVMAVGNFNVPNIVALMSANNKAQVQTYQGATVLSHTNPESQKTEAIGFVGNSIAVLGDLTDVEAAIARNAGAPSSIDPALAAQVSQISSAQDDWMVNALPIASLIPQNAGTSATGPAAQILPILKSIQASSGGFKFGDNVVMSGQLTASDTSNAAALTAVVKLGVSMASMGAANNPQLAQIAQLLQNMQITAVGSTVNLSLSIPEAQVETFLNQVLKPGIGIAKAHPARVR